VGASHITADLDIVTLETGGATTLTLSGSVTVELVGQSAHLDDMRVTAR
jgi:hypothetical protein